MCNHDIKVKVENGLVITYCSKCGAVLDSKPANPNPNPNSWQEGLMKDNGGQILHDTPDANAEGNILHG